MSITEPTVEIGKPKIISDYELIEQDGLKIYCSKVVISKNEEISIKLSSYFGMKHLSIDRIKV